MEASTQDANGLAGLSSARKSLLLAVFCFAQFLDTFNNSSLFSAIPRISDSLDITNANSVWLLSAYQLTFAAFLLSSGRLSDVYNANYVFISGASIMGLSALGGGFVRSQVPLIVIRALMGIGAALTVPSALQLVVTMYPDPSQQGKAITIFVGTSALGNVIGLFIGAIIVAFASWPWVFYVIAITGITIAVLSWILVPKAQVSEEPSRQNKFKRLDPIGVGILSIALILFVFAVTSGSITGWGSARVIANLIIAIVLIIAFFVWEASIPEEFAAVPPRMWRYQNLGILIATALLPFLWFGIVMMLYSWLWQEVYGWSAVNTAIRFLPINVTGLLALVVSDVGQKNFRLKWVILAGMFIAMVGTVLLPFADSQSRYWGFVFPGFVLGTTGVTITFTTANITVFKVTPPTVAGVVGALFNCCLNLGCATGSAIITSIQTSVEIHHGGPTSYDGRAAGFWFLFAFVTLLAVCVAIFMENTVPPVKKDIANELEARPPVAAKESKSG
ncbi:MFS general substrate transporter [Dendrothele bispora CBS 962.96]|uniref:MFS general substrate transporter n=1 Tax=Dendrothele bispora (strain CBS 962.96) TaxID=1314807 RepID=A0A4S8LAU6_DENBC|nr:MFS general substrate transporter [Dendrothele bispora CBS 962.96]